MYEDDKVTFTKDADYLVKLLQALEGFGKWEKKQSAEVFTLKEIKAWLIAYDSTYLSIDQAYPFLWIRCKWDNFLGLYTYLELLVYFLEEFKGDMARYKVVDIYEIDHKELIDWLLQIEQRMEVG